MFVNLFAKDNGEYTRYWASVSTKRYDAKKKKETDEYINASMPIRLIPDMVDVFNDASVKTKNKKIRRGLFKDIEGFFEAVEPKDGEPFVRFVIVDMTPVDTDEDDE